MKKKWMITTRCSFLLVLALFFLPALAGVTQPRVAARFTNRTLEEVLQEIKRQAGVYFMYNTLQVNGKVKITADLQDTPLDEALEIVLRDLPYTYHKEKDYILVLPRPSVPQAAVIATGVVTDERSDPLPGVTIRVKGTSTGATTDVKGNFRIAIPREGATLLFSFVGMTSVEINVEGSDNPAKLTVRMKEESQLIDDVIVTGLFTRKKESFTGSASTFTREDLKRINNGNILSILGHLDPAFIVAENLDAGSDPNHIPDIQIRGTSSLPDLRGEYSGNPNEPLFVLDGFIVSAAQIYDLDVNRVASVTLLKDAAAKAIYGSRAANGVVVVETIPPEAGRLRFSYSGDLNVSAPDLSFYDLCNAEEKFQVEWQAGRYSASTQVLDQFLKEQYNEILKNIVANVNTYWLSKPLREGIGQKHALRLEGGDEVMKYGVDFSYNRIAGVMKESDRETITGSIDLSYRYRNLIFRNMLSISFNRADDSPYGSFSEYSQLNPYWTSHDENGNMKKILGSYQASTSGEPTLYGNPLYNAGVGTKNFSKYTNITENFYAEWEVVKNLRLIGRFGFTHTADRREDFYPGDHTRYITWTGDAYFKRGSYAITDQESKRISADVTANFSRQMGDHLLFANGAWSLSSSDADSHGMAAQGFLNNRVDHITFAKQYQENGIPSGSESISREIGLTGAINYSFDNRYLADVSFRANASSVFGKNSRWGTFWSAGVGWNLHHERFLKDTYAIKQLKLRGSVGSTGSQNFPPYQAMRTYRFLTDRTYDNISGAYLMALANDNLKWQQSLDFNAGIDAQLFGRLNLRFDAYLSRTNDLLIDFTLPTSTGFGAFKENLGQIENKGFDMTLSWQVWRDRQSGSFVSLLASMGHNTNKIRKIFDALKKSNAEQDTQTDNLTSPLTRFEEGQPLDAIWAVRSLGIDPVNGRELFLTKDGTTTYTWNAEDQIVGGCSNPKLRGNLGLTSEYKGVGLSCSFSYQWGADYYNSTLVSRVENVDVAYNVDRRVFEGTWLAAGDHTFFKRITNSPTTTRPTTRFIEKKNEISLASARLYYDFKRLNLKKYHVERLVCSFYMTDVFKISTVKTERGLSYPFARSASFSLAATF
ncbi:MAG: SusC/RagA family TonB-linked outer membrane protein [Odoribacteraceae bacterium]|jgi:TonB-linked SusC/RagA family outer membrane protein|nr:SusC/RagA family TonB-linked outer membrane protein [Odoribacteraceae bacterium]